jgi:hypothetical protein
MATNPQYPQQRGPQDMKRDPDVHGRLQLPPKRAFPWPLIAILAAVAMLAALIAWLPRSPHKGVAPNAAQVPVQPTGSQLQLSNLNMQPAPAGGALYIKGILHNVGNTDVNGVQVQANFLGNNGQILASEMGVLQEVSGEGTGPVENFTKSPVKPNQSRPFRVYFEHTPAGWNREMPGLKVTTVTGTTP